jgi:hypothetical protein
MGMNVKRILFLMLFVGEVFFLTSCCRDCLITNRELSSLKTFKDPENNTVLKINSAWKAVELVMSGNKGIKSYSIDGNSILAEVYPGHTRETYISCVTGCKFKHVKFSYLENGIIDSNSVMFSDASENKKLNLRDVRNYSVNLDNGNLYITEELFNDKGLPLHVIQNDKLKLKRGGYLLLPLSIISNINSEGWQIAGKNKGKEFVDSNIGFYDNYLVMHAIPGLEVNVDPNSGWFAYLRDGLLFIKQYNCENVAGKRVNKLLRIKVDENVLSIYQSGEKKTVLPDSSVKEKQKWSIIAIKNEPDNLSAAIELFKRQELKLRLLINRK